MQGFLPLGYLSHTAWPMEKGPDNPGSKPTYPQIRESPLTALTTSGAKPSRVNRKSAKPCIGGGGYPPPSQGRRLAAYQRKSS